MDDETFKESQGIILDRYEKMEVRTVIFSAVLDDKVCEVCKSKNRKIYEVKLAKGVIPVHKNCRCMWIPLMQGQLFGEVVKGSADDVGSLDARKWLKELRSKDTDLTESVFFV